MDIFLGHPDADTRNHLQAILESLDHRVSGAVGTVADMVRCCVESPPEVIVSGVRYPDGDGVKSLTEISAREPVPAVVIARREDAEAVERALEDHVMAYLIEPVTKDDLRPTLLVVKRRFEQFQELRREIESLKEALAARKKIERAKGILMHQCEITEEQAYLQLRRSATDARAKIVDVAEEVISQHVNGT